MAKGGQGERETANELSKWWTKNEKESVFWRSSQSGGRATVRGRKNLRTHGHWGDVCSTHPNSAPFTDVVVVECKKGYFAVHLSDILDLEIRNPKKQPAVKKLEEWIFKNEDACKVSNTPYWLLVHRRSGRVPFVYFPDTLWRVLHRTCGCVPRFTSPIVGASIRIRRPMNKKVSKVVEIVGMRWSDFLYHVDPMDFRIIARRLKRGKND